MDLDFKIFPNKIIYLYNGDNDKNKNRINKILGQYKKDCNLILNSNDQIDLDSLPLNIYRIDKKMIPVCLLAILVVENSVQKDFFIKVSGVKSIYDATLTFRKDENAITKYNLIKNIKLFSEILTELTCTDKNYNIKINLTNLSKFNCNFIIEMLYKLIQFLDAKLELIINIANKKLSFDNLSEGQLQLIKVLGSLSLNTKEDFLILMDEPEAHMNPKWKYNLKSTIDSLIKIGNNSQVLIATHDPLIINGVNNDYIRILENSSTGSKVIYPSKNTTGLGIDGLLQSEYYGLRTSYDVNAVKLFNKRQELYIKLINNKISDDEKRDLRQMTKELGSLPITNNSIDFLYNDFIQEYKQTEFYYKEYLTYEELKNKQNKIKEIIKKLYEEIL